MLPLFALFLPVALAQGGGQEAKPAAAPVAYVRPYNINFPIEEVRLKDLGGKERALFAENEGKALVLCFWSYRDPVSRHYLPRLSELQAKHAAQLTVVLVDSNHDELVINGDALARLREVVETEKITLPVLVDLENRVADDFDAVNNAQVFLIDANRFLRYKGGIDDDPRGDRAKRGIPVLPLLGDALEVTLRGERPTNSWTMASGRPIRRAPRPGASPEGPK